MEIALCTMLFLEFKSSYFSKFLWLIAVTKNSYWRSSIKKLFLKILQYSQEDIFVGVSFWESCRVEGTIKKRLYFSSEYHEFLRTLILKKSPDDCFCVTLLFHHQFPNSYRIITSCSIFAKGRIHYETFLSEYFMKY